MSARLLPAFCGKDCGGDACPLLAEVEGGVVRRMRANPAASGRAAPCSKGFSLPAVQYSPNRLSRPLKRAGERGSGNFIEISWEEALSTIHENVGRIISKHSPASVINLASAGCTGLVHSTENLTSRFLDSLGGQTALRGSYSNGAAAASLRKVFGSDYTQSGFDPGCLSQSNMIVLWGANVLEARLGSEIEGQIAAAARRGTRIINLDPRCTLTARYPGVEWIPIRPGSDSALLYALLYVLDSEGLADRGKLSMLATGYDELLSHVRGKTDGIPKTPAWAEAISHVPSSRIITLAHEFHDLAPVALLPGYSIQRTESGEEVMRLCVALQLATGNFGKVGGTTGSLNNKMPGPRLKLPGILSSPKPAPDIVYIPQLRWADAILEGRHGGYPADIKAIYSAGGNFLNQGADIKKNVRAFEKVEFSVCHELFLTPTASYCDIVLPAASPLEKEDIGIPWAGNYVLYKPVCVEPTGSIRSDFQIFSDLSSRFGLESRFTCGMEAREWVDLALQESEIADVETFKSSGIYYGAGRRRQGLSKFSASPHEYPLGTASGKVNLEGTRWLYKPEEDKSEAYRPQSFYLVTPKRKDRVHSQGGHLGDVVFQNAIEINDEDARERGFKDGDMMIVRSPSGEVRARLMTTDAIMRGVACMQEGSWWKPGTSKDDAHGCTGSVNILTSTQGTRESVSCVMHGILVHVERAAEF